MARSHLVKVNLSDTELEALDELRGGIPRAVFLRSLIHKAPAVTDVADRGEALGILTSMARDGKVTAAIALAKELSAATATPAGPADPLDELLKAP